MVEPNPICKDFQAGAVTRLPIIERAELDELVRLLAAHPSATSVTYQPDTRAWTLMTGGYGKRNQRRAINTGPSFDVTATGAP